MALEHKDITEAVIGAAFEVYNVLGYGFLERVYQRAMQVELQRRGFVADIEAETRVMYKGAEVGFYKADLWVNRSVMVELKANKSYTEENEPQLLNELKATDVKVGLFDQLRADQGRVQTLCFLICVPSVFHPWPVKLTSNLKRTCKPPKP
jgi:GxxExxY protein